MITTSRTFVRDLEVFSKSKRQEGKRALLGNLVKHPERYHL